MAHSVVLEAYHGALAAARPAARVAVGPVFLVQAHGALVGDGDVLRREAGLEQPPPERAAQVHEIFPGHILFADEPLGVAAEPAFDSLGHVGVGLKAAIAYGRADGGAYVAGPGAEVAHQAHRHAGDVAHRAAPAAVDRARRAARGVVQQQRHAVGREAEDGQALHVRDEAVRVAGGGVGRAAAVGVRDEAHVRAVHLLGIRSAHDVDAERGAEYAVVFDDPLALVAAVEAEVERGEPALGHAAEAGGEGVLRRYDGRGHVDEAVLFMLYKAGHGVSLPRAAHSLRPQQSLYFMGKIRISEALTILPLFTPAAIPGLFVGCLVGNILGGAILPDIIFGSIATLIGAIGTYMLRQQRPVFGTLPPIIANIVIVPFVLRYGYGVALPIPFMMLTVGIGEVASCLVLGLVLYTALSRYRNTLFHPAV